MGQLLQPPSRPASFPTINNDNCCDQIIENSIITKLNNPKMVPINVFKAHLQSMNSGNSNLSSSTIATKQQLINEDNCSIFERELPEELFIQILSYLSGREIIKLGRVCRNFKYYWIENGNVWRGRSLESSDDEPFMYFRPIMETPLETIRYYYTQFLPLIVNAFKRTNIHTKKTNESVEMVIKMVLLGGEGCGKTQWMERVADTSKTFDPAHVPTVGVEFRVIGYDFNNRLVKLQLWDISGYASSIMRAYTRGAKVILYCFDLSDESSFIGMIESFKKYRDLYHSEGQSILFVGLKRDLKRAVSMDQIESAISELFPTNSSSNNDGILMNKLKFQYFEVSSKTDPIQLLQFPFEYGMVMEETNIIEPIHSRQVHDTIK